MRQFKNFGLLNDFQKYNYRHWLLNKKNSFLIFPTPFPPRQELLQTIPLKGWA